MSFIFLIRLKKEKEEERRQLEEEARRLVEPHDPYTGQSEIEAAVREQEIKDRLEASYQEQQQKQRKAREMERLVLVKANNMENSFEMARDRKTQALLKCVVLDFHLNSRAD